MNIPNEPGRNNVFTRSLEHIEYESGLLSDQDDNSVSAQSFATEGENTLRPLITVREWLLKVLHSTHYQVFVVTLVVLDTLIVITELLLDLELAGKESQVPYVLHSISLSFLCLFVVEIFVKLYTFRMEYFSMKGELFDAVVVIVALALDAVSLHSHDAMAGTGLIIVLRLWRIVRIQNSIVMSVHRSSERRVTSERELRKAIETELEVAKEKNKQLRHCCRDLLKLLHEKGIDPSSALSGPISELDVTI